MNNETEVVYDEDGNMIVVGKKAGTKAKTKNVWKEPEPELTEQQRVTLRDLIERGLLDKMQVIPTTSARQRGKGGHHGFGGNGGHADLTRLHEELETDMRNRTLEPGQTKLPEELNEGD